MIESGQLPSQLMVGQPLVTDHQRNTTNQTSQDPRSQHNGYNDVNAETAKDGLLYLESTGNKDKEGDSDSQKNADLRQFKAKEPAAKSSQNFFHQNDVSAGQRRNVQDISQKS